MDIREVPFILFREFAVTTEGEDGEYILVGATAEGYPLRVKQCPETSHLTLWNHHANPETDSPLFSVNAGPSMSGSWRADRGEQYRESIWSTLHPQIGNKLYLPFTPIIGRIMIRAHELYTKGAFETTVTWSIDRGRQNPNTP